jgi:hypothetical protein
MKRTDDRGYSKYQSDYRVSSQKEDLQSVFFSTFPMNVIHNMICCRTSNYILMSEDFGLLVFDRETKVMLTFMLRLGSVYK